MTSGAPLKRRLEQGVKLTKDEIENIAETAAKKAMHDLLLTLGIDVHDPLKAQRDFAILREVGDLVRDPEFRKDIEHTRRWRLTLESLQTKGALALVAAFVSGAAAMIWVGFKVIATGKP